MAGWFPGEEEPAPPPKAVAPKKTAAAAPVTRVTAAAPATTAPTASKPSASGTSSSSTPNPRAGDEQAAAPKSRAAKRYTRRSWQPRAPRVLFGFAFFAVLLYVSDVQHAASIDAERQMASEAQVQHTPNALGDGPLGQDVDRNPPDKSPPPPAAGRAPEPTTRPAQAAAASIERTAVGSKLDGRAGADESSSSSARPGGSGAGASTQSAATDDAAGPVQCSGVYACRGWCRTNNPVCKQAVDAIRSGAAVRAGGYGTSAAGRGGASGASSGNGATGASAASGASGGATDSGASLSSLVSESALRLTLSKPSSSCGRSGHCRFRLIGGSLYRSKACNPRRPNWQLMSGLMVSAVARAEAMGRAPLPDVEICMHQVRPP